MQLEKDQPDYIESIKQGDTRGINQVYKNFYPGIRHFIVKNNGAESDAKDIFHEALMAVYVKSKDPTFELTSSFYTFFYTICRNLWFKELRKKSRDRGTIYEDVVYKSDDLIDNIITEAERESLFWEKFKYLTEDCRQLLTLFFEGRSMDEITDIMQLSSANYAKKKKFKCKEKLVNLIREDRRYKELGHE